MQIFNNPIEVAGVQLAKESLLENSLFFEDAMEFTQFLNELRETEKSTPGSVVNNKKFNVILSWILMFYVIIEVFTVLVEVCIAAARAAITSAQGNNISSGPVSSSYNSVTDEVAFMHMKKNVAAKNGFTSAYNFVGLLRWTMVIGIVVTFKNTSRYVYLIFIIVHTIILFWTIFTLAKGAFHLPSGILILASELVFMFRIISHFILLTDQFGNLVLEQGSVNFWSFVALWSFMLQCFFEFILIFLPYLFGYGKGGNMAKGGAFSESLELDGLENANENELVNRVQSYRTMKSTKKSGLTNM